MLKVFLVTLIGFPVQKKKKIIGGFSANGQQC